MYNCFDIAKQFLKFAEKEGIGIEPMKLLKLTYIAHGWHLGFYNEPLISNKVEAWKYGPVIPDLYRVTKRFGYSSVDYDALDLYVQNIDMDSEHEQFLKIIWNTYKSLNGLELSARTHIEGSPWSEVYDGTFNKIIDNSKIEKYYKNIIANPTNATSQAN